jgi:hypothetical protein
MPLHLRLALPNAKSSLPDRHADHRGWFVVAAMLDAFRIINVASNNINRIFDQLKAEFANTRSLQREFHEVLIDPYTVSLSKHNRGLRNVFKRSGLNHRNQDHWKYLLSIVAAALYPSATIAAAREKKRKKNGMSNHCEHSF